MKINKELTIVSELLNASREKIAEAIGVSLITVDRYLKNNIEVDEQVINRVYDFAYNEQIYFNKIYESMFKDQYQHDNSVVLFHGTKNKISGAIDLSHSKAVNDFGKGFYLGESFEQAATYIAISKSHHIYSFVLDLTNLNIVKFSVEEEWMYAIAYFRGWLDKYQNSEKLKSIIDRIEKADIIIAPIADNKMYDLIDEYVTGVITDLQCINSLAATDLGNQYVIKTNKALNQLSMIEEMFLSNSEKDHYYIARLEKSKVGLDKVKLARIKYRGQGQYIEEALNEETR